MKEYKENLLKNLGVYELRELARNVGVKSPTTKKRNQLEQEIIKISKGEIKPETNKTKKGRPPKSLRKIGGVIDVFIPKELWEVNLDKKIQEKKESVLTFNSSAIIEDEDCVIEGFLRKTPAQHFYIRNKNSLQQFVCLPYNCVSEYSLIEGDKLSVLVKKIYNENQLVFSNILKVNNQEPSAEPRKLDNIEKIVFGKNSLKGFEGVSEGENVLLITQSIKNDIQTIKKAISPLTKEYSVVFLASGVSTYTKLLLEKDFDAELIHTVVEDHTAFTYENVLNAFNYVDLLLKQGKKVVLVAFDIQTLAKYIEEFLILEHKKQTAEEHIEAFRIVKKLLNYGKVLDNSASVTVFAHCLKEEVESPVFKKELSKLPDKVFYL